MGRFAEAITELQRVESIAPEPNIDRDAKLGEYLLKDGQLGPAGEVLGRAVAAAPDRIDIVAALAEAQSRAERWTEAAATLERVVAARPEDRAARIAFARALTLSGNLSRGRSILASVLSDAPDDIDALVASASAHQNSGDPARAAVDAERAVALGPDRTDAHLALAYAHLALGKYESGFREYEWRLPDAGRKLRLGLPPWDGTPMHGQTLVVWTEQGHGDIFQFARFLAPARRAGARITLFAPRRLVRILGSCEDIDALAVQSSAMPTGQRHAMIMSLPRLLATPDPAVNAAYLKAEPALRDAWVRRMADLSVLRVAIAWQGNPAYGGDATRSMPLDQLLPLFRARAKDTRFFSVQKNHGREQIAQLPEDARPYDLADSLDCGGDAFIDTAAVFSAVDLVLTTDTAAAHLAGALGVPVWVLLSAAPDWRWGTAGSTTAWYPSMRLFRQPAPGDWAGAIAQVGDALMRHLEGHETRNAP
jgi:Flp pilus assembly protein TadD